MQKGISARIVLFAALCTAADTGENVAGGQPAKASGKGVYRVQIVKLGDVPGRQGLIEGSRDGLHAAMKLCGRNPKKWTFHVRGKRREVLSADTWRLSVDGKLGPEFDDIDMRSVTFSPDGLHCAYLAERNKKAALVLDHRPQWEGGEPGGSVQFSPDGKRLVCSVSEKGQVILVLDGKELCRAHFLMGWTFSPDSKRFAVVVKGEEGRRERLILDGKEGPQFDWIGTVVFCPSGKRHAYIASNRRDKTDTYWVVTDGRKLGPYRHVKDIEYNPDGRHFAYTAQLGDQWLLVVDDRTYRVDGEIMWYSPIGDRGAPRITYIQKQGGRSAVVVNGRRDPQYDSIWNSSFLVSPDGKRCAYVAQIRGKYVVVHNGKASPEYSDEELWQSSLRLNGDGGRCAYVIRRDGRSVVIVDGKEQADVAWPFAYAPVFSPDGKHVAYIQRDDDKWRLVLDGKPGPARSTSKDNLYSGDPRFSPDSRHVACITRQVLLADGAGPRFDEIVYPGPTFHPDGTLEYLTVKDDVLYRVKHVPKRR